MELTFVPSSPLLAGRAGRRKSVNIRGQQWRAARKVVVATATQSDVSVDQDLIDGEDDFKVADLVSQKVEAETGGGPGVALGNLSSAARKAIAGAFVLGASVAGYKVVPEDKRHLALGSSVVSATVAAAGSNLLLKSSKKGSKKAAATILAQMGPLNPGLKEALEVVKQDFAVDEDQWQLEMRDLYAMYLMEMASSTNGEVRYREINQLLMLKRALGLSGPEIGDAHFEIARAFYRENVIYLGDKEGTSEAQVAQKKLNKLLYLSDRMFMDNEPEEAYMYETARLRKHFGMMEDEYLSRVSSITEPFYEDVVVHAINNPGVQSSDLRAAQKLLGISDVTARAIERKQYLSYVNALVQEKGELSKEDMSGLEELQSLLNITSEDANSILRRVAEPEYKVAVHSAFNNLMSAPDDVVPIYEEIQFEQAKLQVSQELSQMVIGEEVKSRLAPYIASATKFLRVSNVPSSAKEISKLLDTTEVLMKLLTKLNPEATPVQLLKNFYGGDGGQKLREATQLYSIYLQDLLLREGKVSDEEKENLARLRVIFNLSSYAADEAYRKATGPLYKRQLVGIFAANKFDDEAKAKLDNLQKDLTLPEHTAKAMKLESYAERLRSYVKGNRIPTKEDADRLANIRAFLELSDDDVKDIHRDECSGVYEQSITEAMGTSGILMENVYEALTKLRERLFLPDDTANEIFYAVNKGRMKSYAIRAYENLERRRQLRGQGERRDVGDDPFIKRAGAQLGIDASGLNVELHNLVDFYVRNRLMKTKEVEYEEEGEKKTRTVAEFPVTLRDAMQLKTLQELYKQYLIQCFSAKSREEKERLFGVLDQLASILGLTQAEVDNIHSDIGAVIYKNYIAQQLLSGGLAEKDMQFLSNIQQTLAMSPQQCEEIMKEAKKNRVAVLLEQSINRQRILPENAKKVRTTAMELGVDLVEDLKVPNVDRMRCFNVEVDNGIETNAITAENQSLIREAKDGWKLSDEDAKKVLLENIEKRCSTLLVQAASSVRQGNSETAVREISTMLRFGRLLPAEVTSPVVSDAEKQELLLLYQAYLISDSALNEESKKDISLLTTMLGISDEVLQGA